VQPACAAVGNPSARMAFILKRGWRSDSERKGRKSIAYADFVVGGRNSRTLPRSCRGSHFAGFENLIGM
jgi:hypothetical protein